MKGHLIAVWFVTAAAACGEPPAWIWRPQTERPSPAGERAYLTRSFSVQGKVLRASLQAACAGAMEVFIDGRSVGSSPEVRQRLEKELSPDLFPWGTHTLAVFGRTTADGAGLVLQLTLDQEYGKQTIVQSDGEWRISIDGPKGWNQPGFDTAKWERVSVTGRLGDPPFGDVFVAGPAGATPASEVTVPPGFEIELLRSASPGEGSWICLTFDDRGRLYVSPQEEKRPILRFTFGETGSISAIDRLPFPLYGAMGMLWAYDSLYVSADGPDGRAIYRLIDGDKDGEIDRLTVFKKVPGGTGEHGAHAIVLGPDRQLYIAMGNATSPVDGIDPQSPFRDAGEDDLLPRIKDPVATFFDHVRSPYGHILRTDENGTRWEMLCAGLRNAYDIDFDAQGNLFTYDSDMEWDVGLPWYRPTRVIQLMSGGEYGFREGSSKWPEYYADSLPAVINVGLGSPTGVVFGTRSNWPAVWSRAFFIMDWTYGRIMAVHLEPRGAGYTGRVEDFVKGRGLPVTDLEFGPDGAMYFSVGGRGTQGGLYRVHYSGAKDAAAGGSGGGVTAAASEPPIPERPAGSPPAIAGLSESTWRWMASSDRRVSRSAGLIAEAMAAAARGADGEGGGGLKWNPDDFRGAAQAPTLEFLLAVTRAGGPAQVPNVLRTLAMVTEAPMEEAEALKALRVLEVAFARHGVPEAGVRDGVIHRLTAHYPAASFPLNRELSQLLVFLGWPGVVEPTLELMDGAHRRWVAQGRKLPDAARLGPQEESIWFARVLAEVPADQFSADQRTRYFEWFAGADAYQGGNNFEKFLEAIRARALERLDPAARAQVDAARKPPPVRTPIGGPVRTFVRTWTVDELGPHLASKSGRNYARGAEIFSSMLCARCHRCGSAGEGGVGPDLTGAGARFSRRDLLEATLDPSKAISDQYVAQQFWLRDGSTIAGQLAGESPESWTIYGDPYGTTRIPVARADVVRREPSKISLMPAGLLNNLQPEEILDLLAFVESAADPNAPAFKPAP